VRIRVWPTEMMIVVSEELETRVRAVAHEVLRAPFTRRTWSELWFLVTVSALAGVGLAFVALTMAAGVVFAITFFGLAVIGLSLRGARGIGGFQRQEARGLLDEQIDDPDPFVPRPGFLGWLQTVLRDRTAWRSVAYIAVKVLLAILGILTAFSVWFDAFTCLITPLGGGPRGSHEARQPERAAKSRFEPSASRALRSGDSWAVSHVLYASFENLGHPLDGVEHVYKARVERCRAEPEHVGWSEVSDDHPTIDQSLAPRPGPGMGDRYVGSSPIRIGRTGQGGAERLKLVSHEVHEHGCELLRFRP